MKAYLLTTGILFLALTVAHVFRVFQEQHLARDPWFVLITVLTLVLFSWALRLYMTTYAIRRGV